MKILIVGASGFIGSVLFEYFSKEHETYGSFFSNETAGLIYLDMTNEKSVKDIITSYKPDVIIQPAFNSNVEYCEDHPIETWRVNVDGSENLIKAARDIGAKFVFFSSDYVFDGTNGPYSEEDIPNPINEYGNQKFAIENIIKTHLDNFLIIRTTVVYGWEVHGKNFSMAMIKNLKSSRTMKIPYDQIGSPTYVNNMVEVIADLIDSDKVGTYHVAGINLVDRYIFAKTIANVFELDDTLLIPVLTAELGQKANRPLKAGMKTGKVKMAASTQLIGMEDGLEKMKTNTPMGFDCL